MTVLVDGMLLQETRGAEADAATVNVSGRHGWAVYSMPQIQAAHDNVIGLRDRSVPVLFTEKAQLTGFYRVTAANSRLTRYADGAVQHADWSLTLERLGTGRDVEVESRSDFIAKTTDHAVTPLFWQAPAVGFTSYWTGTANPAGTVVRASVDGPVTVYTGLPTTYAPRWTATPEDYLRGAVRLEVAGIRRLGTFTPDAAVWDVHNGLVRLSAPGTDGAFAVACWDGTQWRSEKAWQVTVAGTPLAVQPEVTVLRNEPEEVVVRLTYPQTPGRITVDLGVRRGSRFVTGVMKRHTAATLGVRLVGSEAGTAETGRVRATANDADGNRYVIGSAKTFTALTAGLSKASVTTLDFFAGHALSGSAAQAGDTPADLLQQYLGSCGERTVIVRR